MDDNIERHIKQLHQQAEKLYQDGNYLQAIDIVNEVCELISQNSGKNHPDYPTYLEMLGDLHRQVGDHGNSENLYHQAAVIRYEIPEDEETETSDEEDHYIEMQIEERHLITNDLLEQGNYKQALEIAKEAHILACHHLESDHLLVARSLNNLALSYHHMSSYKAAEELYFKSLNIYRNTLGEEHPEFTLCLNNLASLYHHTGRFDEAKKLYLQASDIYLNKQGEEYLEFALCLNNLGAIYQTMGKYNEAEGFYKQAMEIRCKKLGEDHPCIAIYWNNMAILYQLKGKYTKAKMLFQKAVKIARRSLGKEHPVLASYLYNLSRLYLEMCDYNRARKLLQIAMRIYQRKLGEQHPDFAACIDSLAKICFDLGEYTEAERLIQKALSIRSNTLWEEHPFVATSLNSLATLYLHMGDYPKAKNLYRKSLKITRKALGNEHPDLAIGLHNLAGLYSNMKNTDKCSKSEKLYKKAMNIWQKTLGEEHLDFTQSLNSLALLYLNKGKYEDAKGLLLKAMRIQQKILGEENAEFALSMNNLAFLYHNMGDYPEAEKLYIRSIEIWRKNLGERNPEFAIRLFNLASLWAATDRAKDALMMMRQAVAIYDKLRGQVFSFASDSQRIQHSMYIQWQFNILMSLVYQYFIDDQPAIQFCLNMVFRQKAITAESSITQRDAILSGNHPELEPKLRELKALCMQISQKSRMIPSSEDRANYQQQLADWDARRERLESELARQIPEMNLEKKLHTIDCQALSSALPKGSDLIEFISFHSFDFKAIPAKGQTVWNPARYIAFILHAGDPDDINMVDLGPAKQIDHMITQFRFNMTGIAGFPTQRAMGDKLARNQQIQTGSYDNGSALRATVFDPLSVHIGNCRQILVAPDGELTRLPFEVLPNNKGGYLIDNLHIAYLMAGRDVIRFGANPIRQLSEPLVIADPDFNLEVNTDKMSKQKADDKPRTMVRSLHKLTRSKKDNQDVESQTKAFNIKSNKPLGIQSVYGTISNDISSINSFERLPGTRIEGEKVANLLNIKALIGNEATESKLKSIHSPYILHIATHGFFLENTKTFWNDENRAFTPGHALKPMMENPMLRSGIVLAGVNTWLRNHNTPAEAEDGILTAEDISGLDLMDTELVVLSACETGMGDIFTGEGVFGLRRAFVLAGVKTLITSLWKVDDLATAILMERFYKNLIQLKHGCYEALHNAKLYLRGITIGQMKEGEWLTLELIDELSGGEPRKSHKLRELLQKSDAHKPYTDPYYWGSFICQGVG